MVYLKVSMVMKFHDYVEEFDLPDDKIGELLSYLKELKENMCREGVVSEDVGYVKKRKGKKSKNLISVEDLDEVKRLYLEENNTGKYVADRFGVSLSYFSKFCGDNGISKSHYNRESSKNKSNSVEEECGDGDEESSKGYTDEEIKENIVVVNDGEVILDLDKLLGESLQFKDIAKITKLFENKSSIKTSEIKRSKKEKEVKKEGLDDRGLRKLSKGEFIELWKAEKMKSIVEKEFPDDVEDYDYDYE